MMPGNGYAVLKPKDWTPPRDAMFGPTTRAVELMAQARLLQLQSEHEGPRRTYPQQSHIGRIFIPSSMCPLCIEQKRQKAAARAFWDRQTKLWRDGIEPAPVQVTDETDDAIERFANIIERDNPMQKFADFVEQHHRNVRKLNES